MVTTLVVLLAVAGFCCLFVAAAAVAPLNLLHQRTFVFCGLKGYNLSAAAAAAAATSLLCRLAFCSAASVFKIPSLGQFDP